MATPVTKIVLPDLVDDKQEKKIGHFKADLRHTDSGQDTSLVPEVFIDAMKVRHAVFVDEQNVPAENEFDDDDPRSVHIVTYATQTQVGDGAVLQQLLLPVGTVRIVPFPSGPHPDQDGRYWGGREEGPDGKLLPFPDLVGGHLEDRPTSLHDGKEHYVKLGRLAIVKGRHRGTGLASVLVRAAEEWLAENPRYFEQQQKSAVADGRGAGAGAGGRDEGGQPLWKGLVCVHAQKSVVGLWAKYGFQADQEMGTWFEEGIEHVGMFKRMKVAG